MKKTFAGLTQNYFQFLIDEFHFALLLATESPRDEPWEGNVQYATKSTYVEINCTRGEIPSLWLGRTKDQKKQLMPIQEIYEYMNLSEEEKRIVLAVSEERRAIDILHHKQLLLQTSHSNDPEKRMQIQLISYAHCLRSFAFPFLRGDFSQWLGVWEYHVEKLVVENARAGRPEFVPVVVTDTSGQNRVIGKQSVFKKSLEYIKELKDEQYRAA